MGSGVVQRVVHFRQKGESAAVLELSPDTILYNANSSGSASSSQPFTINLVMRIGSDPVTGFNKSYGTLPTGVSVTATGDGYYTFQVASGASPSGSFVINVAKTVDGVQYTASASVKVAANKQGPNGNNAVTYELVSSATQLKTNAARTTESSATVTAYKIDGSTRSQFTSGTIKSYYYLVGSNTRTNKSSSSTQVTVSSRVEVAPGNTAPVSKWDVTLTVNSQEVAMITIPVIASGPIIRGPRVWSKDSVPYLCGAEGEEFLDVVIYNGNYYQCKTSHSSASNRYPGSNYDIAYGLWIAATSFEFVATNLLLAKRAKIENLFVDEVESRGDWSQGNYLYTRIEPGIFELGHYTLDDVSHPDTSAYTDHKVCDIGMDGSGNACMRFYDFNGNFIGQIDKSLFTNQVVNDSWDSDVIAGSNGAYTPWPDKPTFNAIKDLVGKTVYRFSSGFTYDSSTGNKNINHLEEDQCWYQDKSTNQSTGRPTGTMIAAGYYIQCATNYDTRVIASTGVVEKRPYRWALRFEAKASPLNAYVTQTTRYKVTGDWEPTGEVKPVPASS